MLSHHDSAVQRRLLARRVWEATRNRLAHAGDAARITSDRAVLARVGARWASPDDRRAPSRVPWVIREFSACIVGSARESERVKAKEP
jgi:hypothetical protein